MILAPIDRQNPLAGQKNNMDKMRKMIKELLTEMKEMRNEREELVILVKNMKNEWKHNLEEIEEIKRENEKMQYQIRMLKEKVESMKKKECRNTNIIITGFETTNDTKILQEKIEYNVQKLLGTKYDI